MPVQRAEQKLWFCAHTWRHDALQMRFGAHVCARRGSVPRISEIATMVCHMALRGARNATMVRCGRLCVSRNGNYGSVTSPCTASHPNYGSAQRVCEYAHSKCGSCALPARARNRNHGFATRKPWFCGSVSPRGGTELWFCGQACARAGQDVRARGKPVHMYGTATMVLRRACAHVGERNHGSGEGVSRAVPPNHSSWLDPLALAPELFSQLPPRCVHVSLQILLCPFVSF